MEFICQKRSKNRKKRKRHNKRKKRANFEVTFAKQPLQNYQTDQPNTQSVVDTMEAKAFWQNYAAAQDWQRRHNVVWWRTRCHALENENNVLKDKIRSLLANNYNQKQYSQVENYNSNSFKETTLQEPETEEQDVVVEDENEEEEEEEEEGRGEEGEEDLVFQMNEEMMKFLEQSIRHKMELKKMRESQNTENNDNEEQKSVELDGGQNWVKERTKYAGLLYGEASSRILAMETALQATNERHVDKAKPQLWPNIPLNIKF